MQSKFEFNEIVKIIATDENLGNIYGLFAIVNGKAQNEEGNWSYSVFMSSKNEAWCFEEHELISTGKFSKANDYDLKETLKVIVDKNGKGYIKD